MVRLLFGLTIVLALQVGAGFSSTAAASSHTGLASAKPIWADEFNGRAGRAPSASRWHHDLGASGWGNSELQRYTASKRNAHLDGHGRLVITARRKAGGSTAVGDYSSARLTTKAHFSFLYGSVAMRAKLPAGRGLWPAFWMLGAGFPDLDWPFCGEIDVMENIGSHPRRVYGTVHGPGMTSDVGIGGSHTATKRLSSGYHVYAVKWQTDKITFLFDGVAYSTVLRSSFLEGQTWAFDQQMFLLVNLAVGGEFPGMPSRRTAFPARLQIDWIRVWD